MKEFGRTLADAPRQFLEFASGHPFQSMWEGAGEMAERTKQALANRDYSSAAGYGLAGLLSGVGGTVAAQSGEQLGEGNVGAGAGSSF